MKLHKPFMISARLLPAIEVGGATISITTDRYTDDGRMVYHYIIDHADFCYENEDIKSGCGNGNLVEGMSSLLSFLGHDAEHYRYNMAMNISDEEDRDAYCFNSPSVIEWAYRNSDEISMVQLEIDEAETQLIED